MVPCLTGGVLAGKVLCLTGSTPDQLLWIRGGGNEQVQGGGIEQVQGGGNEQVLQLVMGFYEAGRASGLSPASRLSFAEALAGPVSSVLLAALQQTWCKRGALRIIPETCTHSPHLRVMWVLDVGVQLAMIKQWNACGTTRWTSHAALLWTW